MTYQRMSVGAFICDVCEKDYEDLGNKRFVWAQCRAAGWIQRGSRHFCPDCRADNEYSVNLDRDSE